MAFVLRVAYFLMVFFPLLQSSLSEFWSISLVNMAAKWLEQYKNPKFQSKSLKTAQFGQFFSAGRTGPLSSESRKNPAENRTVVTLHVSALTELMGITIAPTDRSAAARLMMNMYDTCNKAPTYHKSSAITC